MSSNVYSGSSILIKYEMTEGNISGDVKFIYNIYLCNFVFANRILLR